MFMNHPSPLYYEPICYNLLLATLRFLTLQFPSPSIFTLLSFSTCSLSKGPAYSQSWRKLLQQFNYLRGFPSSFIVNYFYITNNLINLRWPVPNMKFIIKSFKLYFFSTVSWPLSLSFLFTCIPASLCFQSSHQNRISLLHFSWSFFFLLSARSSLFSSITSSSPFLSKNRVSYISLPYLPSIGHFLQLFPLFSCNIWLG